MAGMLSEGWTTGSDGVGSGDSVVGVVFVSAGTVSLTVPATASSEVDGEGWEVSGENSKTGVSACGAGSFTTGAGVFVSMGAGCVSF